jgi:hypothetical protein
MFRAKVTVSVSLTLLLCFTGDRSLVPAKVFGTSKGSKVITNSLSDYAAVVSVRRLFGRRQAYCVRQRRQHDPDVGPSRPSRKRIPAHAERALIFSSFIFSSLSSNFLRLPELLCVLTHLIANAASTGGMEPKRSHACQRQR